MPGPSTSARPRWISSATLDGHTLVVPLDRHRLDAALGRLPGVSLAELPGWSGEHPVCVELWDVRDGAVVFGELGQDRLWTDAMSASAGVSAAASGAALGALFGGVFGWLSGGARGLTSGTAAGVRFGWQRGSELGAATGQATGASFSRMATRSLGNYRELMVGIPGVLCDGRGPFFFVLEMASDSSFAVSAARALGYGYGKRLARFEVAGQSWRVRTPSGEALLEVELEPAENGAAEPSPSSCEPILEWLSQPLLGYRDGGFMVSELERKFERQAVRASSLGCVLHGEAALSTELLRGRHEARGIGYEHVAARVSAPRALSAP
jgi:hypothetical protein